MINLVGNLTLYLLIKKLRSISGRICRIKMFLPETLHKQIYHSLFESHLSFAISVWGGVSNNQLEPLFITQKKCIRILFGDYESYIDKYRTCARVRSIESQRLGSQFYKKESTKPLFTKYKILTVVNLYKLRCIMEFLKIMKYRIPISLYSLFEMSSRKATYMITPTPTHHFIYKSAWLWNEFRKIIGPMNLDFSSSCSSIKAILTKSLINTQCMHGNDWHKDNFYGFNLQ